MSLKNFDDKNILQIFAFHYSNVGEHMEHAQNWSSRSLDSDAQVFAAIPIKRVQICSLAHYLTKAACLKLFCVSPQHLQQRRRDLSPISVSQKFKFIENCFFGGTGPNTRTTRALFSGHDGR
jgi:hypothetical protein